MKVGDGVLVKGNRGPTFIGVIRDVHYHGSIGEEEIYAYNVRVVWCSPTMNSRGIDIRYSEGSIIPNVPSGRVVPLNEAPRPIMAEAIAAGLLE